MRGRFSRLGSAYPQGGVDEPVHAHEVVRSRADERYRGVLVHETMEHCRQCLSGYESRFATLAIRSNALIKPKKCQSRRTGTFTDPGARRPARIADRQPENHMVRPTPHPRPGANLVQMLASHLAPSNARLDASELTIAIATNHRPGGYKIIAPPTATDELCWCKQLSETRP